VGTLAILAGIGAAAYIGAWAWTFHRLRRPR
jgi:hypothetical protein